MSWVEPKKKQSGDSLSIENSMSENGIMNISHCLNLEMNAKIGFVSNNQPFFAGFISNFVWCVYHRL